MSVPELRDSTQGFAQGMALAEGPPLDDSALILPADHASVFETRTPGKPALMFRPNSWTYAELDRECNAAVTLLKAHGIGPGGRFSHIGKYSTCSSACCWAACVPAQ